MKTLFIVNPRSGLRRRTAIADVIGAECASSATPHEVVSCGSIEELDGIIDRAERDNFEVVYAVGGDGTVHEIAKRLIGRSLALGILPTGSGNGYARHLRLPIEPRASLKSCLSGSTVTVDTAEVNGLPFLAILGVGLDAVIAERFASSTVRGLRTYIKEGLKTLIGFRPETYELDIDGQRLSARAHVIAVANSSQYGNNARIAPVASLQDGLLDVVIVEELSVASLIRLFHGTLHLSKRVRVIQGREVRIRRANAGPAHLDGEPLALPEELIVRIVPMSLKVLLPSNPATI